MDAWIGIDPGKTGAMGIIYEDYQDVYDYEEVPAGLNDLYYKMEQEDFVFKALLEKQQAFPGQGVVSMFKLGENYGKWQGWLDMLGIGYEIITPVQWRKQIFDSAPKQADKKAMSLDMARRLFPKMRDQLSRKMDHGRAEALLLAELCKQKSKGRR